VQPSAATIEIGTQAASNSTVLYVVEFTLHLPPGVSVLANPDGMVQEGMLHTFDKNSGGASFFPATASSQASVKVDIIVVGGFVVGPLASLTCTVAPGTVVSTSSFLLDGFSAKDENAVIIPGVTPRFTVQTQ
jgi:hypothetical protein